MVQVPPSSSFSVSDAKVATVSSSGVITAKAPGTATVTVRSKENNKTATCTVTVIERVQSVSLSNTAETLYVDRNGVGQTLFLVAEIFPANATNKTVVWSSSDTSVAEVSANGTVTAKKSGVALITATSDDGKKTASCAVTVLQNVSGISFEKSEVTVNRGGESVRLIATVEPADAYNKNIIWTFENEAIATVDGLFPFGSVHGICPVTELQIAVFLLTSVDFSQLADVGTPVGGQVPGKFLALDRSCCDN